MFHGMWLVAVIAWVAKQLPFCPVCGDTRDYEIDADDWPRCMGCGSC